MKLIKKVVLFILAATVILFFVITITFNRSLPGRIERQEAEILGKAAMNFKSEIEHKVFYKAGRDAVFILIYGIVDSKTQDKLIEELKASLKRYPFSGKVQVTFYTEWDPVVFPEQKGWSQGSHKESTQLREVEIN